MSFTKRNVDNPRPFVVLSRWQQDNRMIIGVDFGEILSKEGGGTSVRADRDFAPQLCTLKTDE